MTYERTLSGLHTIIWGILEERKCLHHCEMGSTGQTWDGTSLMHMFLPAWNVNETNHALTKLLAHYTPSLFLTSISTLSALISSVLCLWTTDLTRLLQWQTDWVQIYKLLLAQQKQQQKSSWTFYLTPGIVRMDGCPLEIISNRDKLFISKFWKIDWDQAQTLHCVPSWNRWRIWAYK